MEQFFDSKERFYISAGFALGIISTYIVSFLKFVFYDYLNWQYSLIIISFIVSSLVPRFFRMRKQVGALFDIYKAMSPALRSTDAKPMFKLLETFGNLLSNTNPHQINTNPPQNNADSFGIDGSLSPSDSIKEGKMTNEIRDPESICACYSIDDKEHEINVPFVPSLRRAGNRFIVYIIDNNNNLKDVTHQAGVPYFCTAKQIGGIGYRVVDRFDGRTVIEYGENEIPDLDSFREHL